MKIVLIAPNVSQRMSGEAIKGYQYFQYLLAQGYDAYLCTHNRCRDELIGVFPTDRLILIPDDRMTLFLFKSRVLSSLLNLYFQRLVKRRLVADGFRDAIWHFLTPISPVEPKFFPKGQPVVIGPLCGNLYYPPAFADRMGQGRQLAKMMHRPAQMLFRLFVGDKKRAQVVLNSGYARTRQSLHWAGVKDADIVDVLDAALPDYVNNAKLLRHEGVNSHFVSLGRLVDVKAHDLSIRGLAKCPPSYQLTLYGTGEDEGKLRDLAAKLDVQDRVHFAGWLDHADIAQLMAPYRGFLFPSLAEANGIAMQEMMMLGLPVIALNWGGPAHLANDDAAILIAPDAEGHVVDQIAQAMVDLAENPDRANALAGAARQLADGRFSWEQVGQSWAAAYDRFDFPN